MEEDGFFWVEFANDDLGPFVSRELAVMAARLSVGSWERCGSERTDDWGEDAQVFRSGSAGREPIVALVAPARESRSVAWWYMSERGLAELERDAVEGGV